MTNRTKVILIIIGAGAAGTGFWLWWRQKDAVPPSAIPILQQARAVLAGTTASGTPAGSGSENSILSSIFGNYIPLPTI